MAVLANSSNKRRGSWKFPAPARSPHGSGRWVSRPRWRVILVKTAGPAGCCSHEWGVGVRVGRSQGWADVLVDLMRNPVEQQNF